MSRTISAIIFAQLIAAGNAQMWLDSGLREYASGRYADAARSFSMAVREDPASDIAHYHLANSLLRIGHRARSMQEYQTAYTLSRSAELSENCRRALEAYGQRIPVVRRESLGVHRERLKLSPVEVDSVKHINDLAAGRSGGRSSLTESHSGGVEVFKGAPENKGQLRADWNAWIDNFRMAFNGQLGKELRARGQMRRSGRARMVFSVDTRRKLRGKIVDSDAPEAFNVSLIETTRKMDGWQDLTFPHDSAIPGFNFTMSWDYGAPLPDGQTDTTAALRRTTAGLRTPAGQHGTAGSLGVGRVSGQIGAGQTGGALSAGKTGGALSTQAVSGKIGAGKITGQLGQSGATGALSAGGSDGLPLPTFDTSVTGLLLPKKKMEELKAKPLSLPLSKKMEKSRKGR